jgi:phage gp36-like protein
MELEYTINDIAILINSPLIPNGSAIRALFTTKHTENTLDAIGINATAALSASILFEWLAAQNSAENPALSAAYTAQSEKLRSLYHEITQKCGQFATPDAIIERFDCEEIAQRVDKTGLITGDLLKKAINSTLTNKENADAAKNALKKLCIACTDADNIVLSHIQARAEKKELDNSFKKMLNAIACDIAYYLLHNYSNLEKDAVVIRRYESAITLLKEINQGKFQTKSTESMSHDIPRIKSAKQERRKGF